MARSSDLEGGKPNARKRKLNLIYFVDSARTKSLSIPLGRLKVLIALQLCLLAWSVGSIGALVWLQRGKSELRQQLADSLKTVFEYESRYDRVYEIAYPGEISSASANLSENDSSARSEVDPTTAAAADYEMQPSAEPRLGAAHSLVDTNQKTTDDASNTLTDLPDGEVVANKPTKTATVTKPAAPVAAVAQQRPAAASAAPAVKDVDSNNVSEKSTKETEAKKNLEGLISITNPVIEPKANELELRFDLTNKSARARAEGFLWAVAEFQTGDGRKVFLGAPAEIDVNETGEPRNLARSASFGIKHFKKKSFSFPYAKYSPGIFTAIRIGVMDKSGTDRTTYHVPIEVRVPQGS